MTGGFVIFAHIAQITTNTIAATAKNKPPTMAIAIQIGGPPSVWGWVSSTPSVSLFT